MLVSLLLKNISRLSGSDIPAVNMVRYLNLAPGWQDDCRTCAHNLRNYGVMYVKDPRADYSYNWKIIDLME